MTFILKVVRIYVISIGNLNVPSTADTLLSVIKRISFSQFTANKSATLPCCCVSEILGGRWFPFISHGNLLENSSVFIKSIKLYNWYGIIQWKHGQNRQLKKGLWSTHCQYIFPTALSPRNYISIQFNCNSK